MKSYIKKITSVVLSLAIAVGATSFTKFSNVNAQETPATPQEPSVLNEENAQETPLAPQEPSGTNADNADLVINDLAGLVALRDSVNSGIFSGVTYEGKTIILNADIDMSPIDNWIPIGMSDTSKTGPRPFKGTFEGGMHKISNMKIENNDTLSPITGVGLFGYIEKAVIRNLGVENASIEDTCATQNFHHVHNVGGLVGLDFCGTIINCYAKSSIKAVYECFDSPLEPGPKYELGNKYVGGILGNSFGGTIYNSYAMVNMQKSNDGGGLVGHSTCYSLFRDCYAIGEMVTELGDGPGGLAADTEYATVVNCYAAVHIKGSKKEKGGGLIGQIYSDQNMPVENSYYNKDLVNECRNQGTPLSTSQITGDNAKTNMKGFDFKNIWETRSNDEKYLYYPCLKSQGPDSVVPIGPMQINTIEDLIEFRDNINSAYGYLCKGLTVNLNADIDLSSIDDWDAIGTDTNPFEGTFKGNNHKISNLKIDKSGEDYQGLFAHTNGATIENLGLENVNIKGKRCVGGLVGCNDGRIENSYAKGTVTGTMRVGGLVGCNTINSATITNSYGAVEVKSTAGGAGGLVGENVGTIENSYGTGTTTVEGNYAGGLVGYNVGTIKNSYGTGNTKGVDYVGGLVGGNQGGLILGGATIENSYGTGTTTGINYVGGLVGYSNGGGTKIENSYGTGATTGKGNYVGGLVGSNGGTIENSYGTGSVAGSYSVGGLVGENSGAGGTIENSYGTGSVAGSYSVGGLVGDNSNFGGVITNSYAIGEIKGKDKVGGLVGDNGGTVTNSYYNKDTTGQSDTGKGTPLETIQMIGDDAKTNMTGFDFESVWGTKESEEIKSYYPYLRNFGADSAPYIENVKTITEINTLEDLIEFRDNVKSLTTYEGVTVNLNADIDMSSIDNWNAIGTYTSSTNNKSFKGTFKGNNHKISNLKINKPGEENQGLFGYIEGGTIENIGVENAKVNGQMSVGSLVGLSNGGTITTSYATGEVKATEKEGKFVGGLVGRNYGTITTSYATGTVTGTVTETHYVGGLVGANGGTIKNSYATGTVTGTYYVGGLVGDNSNFGGVITNSYAIGEIKGKDKVGGLVGDNGGTVTNSYYNKDTTGQSDTGKGTPLSILQMIGDDAKTNMTGFDFESVWATKARQGNYAYYPYLRNFGSDSAPYIEVTTEINTIEDLIEFRDNVESLTRYEEVTVNLNADIDMSSIDNWDVIGTDANPFKGTFNGNNHKISNLKINKYSEENQGLFGYIEGGTIENIGVENAKVNGQMNVGSLVGKINDSKIENSYATGEATGSINYVGGLVGQIKKGTIENSYGAVDVTGRYNYVGGLVGENLGTIENSYGTGKVTGGYYYVGGLVGSNGGTIENSYAIGEIKGKDEVGGLVGDNDGTVTNSYYDKDKTGQSDTGKGIPLKTTQMTGECARTNMKGFDFNNTWGIKTGTGTKVYYPYLKNFGAESAIYAEDVEGVVTEINTIEDLIKFRDNVNSLTTYEGATVNLNADIDMSTIDNWDAIGTSSNSFKGTFNGNNHKISNLKINKEKESYQGLFGKIEGATIENLGVEDANVKGNSHIGGLVGYNVKGEIKNSYATGIVTGIGDVKIASEVGGLVGINNGRIENSYATSSVTGTDVEVGGLVGKNIGTIENSYGAGEVAGEVAGGLVGYNSGGTITNSYYDKYKTGQSDTGKGTPLESAQMVGDAAQTNMTGFDFNSVWGIKATEGIKSYYPYLKSFGEISAQKIIIINNIEDLKEFRDSVNTGTTYEGETAVLNSDIDMSTIDNWDAIGVYTSAIGKYNKKPFKGRFNGNKHKISNLKINKGKEAHQGLFGYTEGATIENLGVENVNIRCENNSGGLVGSNEKGIVINSYATGELKGSGSVGGLVGGNSGRIENSYEEVEVTGINTVGGLVGSNYEGIIENSYGAGSVTGNEWIGGLVGTNREGTIKSSYVAGKVTGKGKIIGGLVGENSEGTITNSYYDKERTGQSDTGKGTPLETTQMTGDAAKTNMTGFDFSSTWGTKTTEGTKSYYPYLKNFGEISVPYIEAITEINTIEDLIEFRDSVKSLITYEGATVNLNADIDMSGVDNWDAIGTNSKPFKGTFEGGNHKVSNLKIDGEQYQALFGYIEGATIENLGVEDANVKGNSYVGGLVGSSNGGTIKNSYATGEITGRKTSDTGGLVGVSNGRIENSYMAGEVIGYQAGGLVGVNNGTIENSYATGKVIGTSDYVGELVGRNGCGTVTNSYYDKERACQSDTGKGTPLETTQMIGDAAQMNMTGFDFNSVWATRDNGEEKGYYPYLKNFGEISAPFIELK